MLSEPGLFVLGEFKKCNPYLLEIWEKGKLFYRNHKEVKKIVLRLWIAFDREEIIMPINQ